MPTTDTVSGEYRQAREHCVYFWMDDFRLIGIQGADTFSFLQSQTTNDCLRLGVGEGCPNAVATRKANLLATFSLHKTREDRALILVEAAQQDKLLACLEQFHIREDFTFETHLPEACLLALQGPKSPVLISVLTGQPVVDFKTCEIRRLHIGDDAVWVLERNLTGEEGYIIALPEAARQRVLDRLLDAGAPLDLGPLGPETREVLRIEAGLPVYGKDMDEKVLLPETGLEHSSVSYHKGCYTGQEVIARLKTYGAPSFALMGLIFEGEDLPPFGAEIKLGTRRIGVIKSGTFSLSLGRAVALAYIQKEHRSPDQTLEVTIEGHPWKIKTALLPFHQAASNLERAKDLHHQAMTLYKEEENLDRPIALLREAIALAPKFALAYEALGVLLSRQNKLDEAIALMKRLTEIDPTEIMAHSNLSVYYMQQGRIEDAEAEKGEATALQFEKLIEENQLKKAKEKRDHAEEEERERQIGMFQQVLEIDPIDQVANFGLGTIYFEQGHFDTALAPLQTVVENYKDYSAAWLALGKTLEKLDRPQEAAEVYRKGIAAASKKGDLMPLRDMQNRLNQLSHSSP